MNLQIETALKEHGLAHDKALDWLFNSWNEEDLLEKQISFLKYKKHKKQADKLAGIIAKLAGKLYE